MTGPAIVVYGIAGIAGAVAVLQDNLTSGQNWTLIGILGAAFIGGGIKVIAALGENTKATNAVAAAQQNSANAVSALTLELRALITQHYNEARNVHDVLNELPLKIAEHLRGKLP